MFALLLLLLKLFDRRWQIDNTNSYRRFRSDTRLIQTYRYPFIILFEYRLLLAIIVKSKTDHFIITLPLSSNYRSRIPPPCLIIEDGMFRVRMIIIIFIRRRQVYFVVVKSETVCRIINYVAVTFVSKTDHL